MKYNLRITQYEENENYKDDLKEFKQNQSYGYSRPDTDYPKRVTEVRAVDVLLTEEEYLAIKKEVLKTI